jgi:tripartite-type tricarboxylate transporter receptor subunit TctC
MSGKWERWFVASTSVVLLGMAAIASPPRAIAADYPSRPLRLVVPFPPGGAADILARGVVPAFSERLRQQIVVDNRPGANGVIGFELVARSPADGYTLLLGFTSGVAINPFLVSKASYDPERDFAPVSMLSRTPMTLIASPFFAAKSVQDLIAMAKGAPGKLSYASPGTGNPNHLAGELFKMAAGVNLVHVPYKGAGPAMVDVMAGHVPIAFVTLAAALPQVRAGKLKSLAITSDMRWPALPGVPTMVEAGLKGVDVVEWFGLLAPTRTARAVISRLADETVRIVGSTDIQQRLIEQGLEPVATSGDQFAAVIRSDIIKLSKVIKQAGIRID